MTFSEHGGLRSHRVLEHVPLFCLLYIDSRTPWAQLQVPNPRVPRQRHRTLRGKLFFSPGEVTADS